jgi:hypothetical protein
MVLGVDTSPVSFIPEASPLDYLCGSTDLWTSFFVASSISPITISTHFANRLYGL